jgi:hypothetical protein
MSQQMSRRAWLKTVGAASVTPILVPDARAAFAPAPRPGPPQVAPPAGTILPLTSTSEVFVPPRGRSFMKFSFDFPEPSVQVGPYRFGFLVFTHENAYGLDASRMSAAVQGGRLTLTCSGFVWAGGQEKAAGRLEARFDQAGPDVEWRVTVEMDRPVKAVTTVLRGVPRGRISAGGAPFYDPRDGEQLFGYPFSGGDLFGPGSSGGLTTPLVMVETGEHDYFHLSSLDDTVRTKRVYFQPGEGAYRVEAGFETEGWRSQTRVTVPPWRAGRAASVEAIGRRHYDHVARAYHVPAFDTRPDAPPWMRKVALALTLHGQHYTGYIFNDYARMLEILRWVATRIPADRVLAFLASWDGRYYWDYPVYRANGRMGGEDGLRTLVAEGRKLGFAMMPMFGANAANRGQAVYGGVADAFTEKIDGDRFDLNWVDWDNDRHQDGWLSYMNLGVDSWRTWLAGRIADFIERYRPDAYFLDIVGGWVNNPKADMHEGTRRLVTGLRGRYPEVAAVGEMHYDGLLEFIPMYHSFGQTLIAGEVQKYARFFQHLSHPAPGRGSSGVHESGFGRWNPETLSLSDVAIPTLNVVDDTFDTYRKEMDAVIQRAKARAHIET